MLKNLLPAGLAHVYHGGPVPVLGPYLLLRLTPRPVPAQAHPARLLPGLPLPGPPASPAAPPLPPAVPPAASPRPELRRHRSPGTRPHLAHLPQASAEPPWPPPATALPRSVSPQVRASCWRTVQFQGHHRWRIEQSYKQVKDQLGWADFQVRSDTAIRRHQALVNCAFCFCWDAWFHDHPARHQTVAPRPEPGRGEGGPARRLTAGTVLAPGATRGTRLAFPLDRAATLVAGMVGQAPAAATASPDQLGRGRLRPAPLHPELTNYR